MQVGRIVISFALAALALAFAPVAGPAYAASNCDMTASPTMTVYLPNITKTLGGPNGWVTPFIVQNVGPGTATLEVSFYSFTDGSLVTCHKITGLLVGTSFAEVPNEDPDLPGNSQFAVVVRAFGAQVVSVVNEHQGTGSRAEAGSYVGVFSGANRVYLPWVAKSTFGNLTTFIIQNLGSARASVTASFIRYADTGPFTLPGVVTTVGRSVAPGRSVFVDPRIEPTLPAGSYAVALVSDQPIGVVANMHKDAPDDPRPTLFSYNGIDGFGPAAYLPYVPRNVDTRTAVLLIMNAGAQAATPTIQFFPLPGGTVITLSATRPIEPGGSWAFTPRFKADGTTACPPTVSDGSCVGDGEWAAVVTGGQFAVLGAMGGPTSAFGYTSVSTGRVVFLPNVTRTLGGPDGWTTPFIIQSAGATAATVRWFRFADGERVQTQQITGMTEGASVRIDPRNVSNLAESTQYAVVIESAGAIGAVVTELNNLPGDGAMAYEGFAAN